MGSVVYGVSHLECPLIVVLGHESCGAITKSLASDEEIQKEPSAILALIEKIRSNIPAALLQGSVDSSVITAAIRENTKAVVKQIETEPSIAALISDKKVRVVGGYYILRSGSIQWQ
jgi:carbonic anhydrase